MITFSKELLLTDLNQKLEFQLKSASEYEGYIRDENPSTTSNRFRTLEKQAYYHRCAARDLHNLIQNIELGTKYNLQ